MVSQFEGAGKASNLRVKLHTFYIRLLKHIIDPLNALLHRNRITIHGLDFEHFKIAIDARPNFILSPPSRIPNEAKRADLLRFFTNETNPGARVPINSARRISQPHPPKAGVNSPV